MSGQPVPDPAMTEQRLTQVARHLVAAFADDLFFQMIFVDDPPGSPQRQQRMEAYFRHALDEAGQYGLRVVLDDDSGAALWQVSQPSAISAQMDEDKDRLVRELLGPLGLDAYRRINVSMAPYADAVRPPGAWYLSIIGVAPALQGTGRARLLMERSLAQVDAVGVPCLLETFTPRNVPFYEHFGFQVGVTYIEPTTGQQAWALVRHTADAKKAPLG